MDGTKNNGGWNKALASMLWVVACSFAALCVTGYFFLTDKVDAETNANAKIIVENRERLVRLEECVSTIKSDISEIKKDTRVMLRVLNKALPDETQ